MNAELRTAVVSLLISKALEIDEPDWCTGHRTDEAQFKPDITHYGPEHAIEINGVRVLQAMLAQSPYAQRAPRDLTLYVEEGSFTGSYSPAGVEQLADALEQAAAELRVLGHGLADLIAGGGR
ncbi:MULTISPECIES: DUF6907 domain-containing protein [unclassified Streptomyces]|uniref:DUF6907 domain-containing protein n=1 Tax=unclassified Streptomyces TaxID=2593676 RepID=UPI00093F6BE3|nr:hypothetical protein [Streptomyces sp. CB01883]OKJ73353.1 hypothetical protein AMK32_37045 [Streptomyces sp. CB01883]